jgi:ABC-type multidrug transport system ATPase subunit
VTADLPAVTATPGAAKIIEARDLVLSFGETPALRGASLGVRRGEIVAVMAPLDSVSGELVMDLLTAGAREHGTTVVLVTHDARVAAYADREVIVRDGKVGTLTGAQP